MSRDPSRLKEHRPGASGFSRWLDRLLCLCCTVAMINPLHAVVAQTPSHVSPRPPTFTRGTPETELRRLVGPPDSVRAVAGYQDTTLAYRRSEVTIRDRKVAGWANRGELNPHLGDKAPNPSLIELGSSETDVLQALGTPLILEAPDPRGHSIWRWGATAIRFTKNRVTSWVAHEPHTALFKSRHPQSRGTRELAVLPPCSF